MSCLSRSIELFDSSSLTHINRFGRKNSDDATFGSDWGITDNSLSVIPTATSYYYADFGCLDIPCQDQEIYYMVTNEEDSDATLRIEVEYSPYKCMDRPKKFFKTSMERVAYDYPSAIMLSDFNVGKIGSIKRIKFTEFSDVGSIYTIYPFGFTTSEAAYEKKPRPSAKIKN